MDLIGVIRGETGNLVRIFRTNGWSEWPGPEFAQWVNKKGIRHETSAYYIPEQNGVSERGIRTGTEGLLTNRERPPHTLCIR